jgi:glycosyl transferase family 25
MKKSIIFLFVALISFAALYNSEYWSLRRYLFLALRTKITNSYDSIKQIEKIYVLNMDKSTFRMERMEKILKDLNLGIKVERFSAIIGKNVTLINKDTKNSIIVSDIYNKQKNIEEGGYNIICSENNKDTEIHLTKEMIENPTIRFAGEIGVFCSHKEIWRNIFENKIGKALILEDDIEFIPFSKEILAKSLENIPSDSGLVYLGIFRGEGSLDLTTRKYNYSKVIKDIASTEAYISTENSSRILFNNSLIYTKPVDLYMSDEIEKNSLKAYAITPILTKQVLDSDISLGK